MSISTLAEQKKRQIEINKIQNRKQETRKNYDEKVEKELKTEKWMQSTL